MLDILKKLFQPTGTALQLDPRAGWKEVQALPDTFDLQIPQMTNEPCKLTSNQQRFLEDLKFPSPEQLNSRQAEVILSSIQYVRNLYADNFKRNLSQCPPKLYLNMLTFMLTRADIREYVEAWNKSMFKRGRSDSDSIRPFAKRRDNPLHIEIQQKFSDMASRL